MTPTCSVETKLMNEPCSNLTGILRTTRKSFAGRTFLNLEAFAPASEWEFISKDAREGVVAGGANDIQLHAD